MRGLGHDRRASRMAVRRAFRASYSGVRLGAMLLLVACGPGNPDPARTIENRSPAVIQQVSPPAIRPAAPPGPAKVWLEWADVVTTSGCFYFSGPQGRDDRLTGDVTVERKGDDIRLYIGDETFTGTFRDNELAVERHSIHDFNGPWTVTETIRGQYHEGLMRATYRYEECAVGDPCPGRCTIDANLLFLR